MCNLIKTTAKLRHFAISSKNALYWLYKTTLFSHFSKKCVGKMVVGKKIMLTFAVAFLGNESERPVIINYFTNYLNEQRIKKFCYFTP